MTGRYNVVGGILDDYFTEKSLLVMTLHNRTKVLSGYAALDDMIEEMELDGVKCEVRSCMEESGIEVWEFGEDDVRNLCTVHYHMMEQEFMGQWTIPIRWHWDDGTSLVTVRGGVGK